MTLKQALLAPERRYWAGMLKRHKHNIMKVARLAGVARSTVYRRLLVLGLISHRLPVILSKPRIEFGKLAATGFVERGHRARVYGPLRREDSHAKGREKYGQHNARHHGASRLIAERAPDRLHGRQL